MNSLPTDEQLVSDDAAVAAVAAASNDHLQQHYIQQHHLQHLPQHQQHHLPQPHIPQMSQHQMSQHQIPQDIPQHQLQQLSHHSISHQLPQHQLPQHQLSQHQLSQHQMSHSQHQLPQQVQHIPGQQHHFASDLTTQALSRHLEMLSQQVKAEDLLEGNLKKVAPRSSDLYKIGPQFNETRHHQDVYCQGNDLEVTPRLHARIDRGFEMGDEGTWIGYKRNYFTLVASFSIDDFDFLRFIDNKFYTYEKLKSGQEKVEISYFAIRLVAKCTDDEVNISLVQHTPKRDKGPQFPPPIYPAVPGDLPDHTTVKISSNKRNVTKIDNLNKIFYFDRADYYRETNLNTVKDNSILKNYPSDSIARIARFERIQFTSSIRMRSSSVNNRFFTLHVELLGIIEDEDSHIQPILLSSIESPPLIIRGRSPSNYHKDKTSGYRNLPVHLPQ